MNQKRKKSTLIILLFILLLVWSNVMTYYIARKPIKEELKATTSEQIETLLKLDSLRNVVVQQEEMYAALGKENEELADLKLELEKNIQNLKNGAYVKTKELDILKDQVEQYEFMLREKDDEIAKLKETASELFSDNQELKETIVTQVDSIKDLQIEKTKLITKVKEASMLNAENFSVVYLTKKGKVKEKQPFKAKDVDQLKVSWKVSKNALAASGQRNFYLIVKEPTGTAIYDESQGAGTFEVDEKTYFYTTKVKAHYDNTKNNIASALYQKGSQFLPGTYQIEIFAEGHMIGKTAFMIK